MPTVAFATLIFKFRDDETIASSAVFFAKANSAVKRGFCGLLSSTSPGFPYLIATGFSLMPKTHASSQGAGHVVPVNSGKLLVSSNLSRALFHSPWRRNSKYRTQKYQNITFSNNIFSSYNLSTSSSLLFRTEVSSCTAATSWDQSCSFGSYGRLVDKLVPGGDAVAQGAASTTLVRTVASGKPNSTALLNEWVLLGVLLISGENYRRV